MHQVWASKQKAFTIVELLIVIVVIAILAAITIIAYTGIQDRAKQAALQSAASQASKQILAYAALNTDLFPPDEATFFSSTNLADTSDTDYTYLTSPDRTHYCISATNPNNPTLSTAVSDTSSGTVEGRCVRNLALDPDTTNLASILSLGSTSAPYTHSIDTTNFQGGDRSYKKQISGSGQSAGATKPDGSTVLAANTPLSWSFWVYSTRAGSITPYVEAKRTADLSNFGAGSGTVVPLPSNQWTRVDGTIAALSASITLTRVGGYNTSLQSGDSIWYDSYIITATPYVVAYGDGNSQGWVWDGAANNSTSFGPAKRL